MRSSIWLHLSYYNFGLESALYIVFEYILFCFLPLVANWKCAHA